MPAVPARRALAHRITLSARDRMLNNIESAVPSDQDVRVFGSDDQYLCIGSTHQPSFRAVLTRLAKLDYVARIDPSFAE